MTRLHTGKFGSLAALLLVISLGGKSGPAMAGLWEAAPSEPAVAAEPVGSPAAPMRSALPVAAARKPPIERPAPSESDAAAAATSPALPPLPPEARRNSSPQPASPQGDPPAPPRTGKPTLANARWIGFTPAAYPGGDGIPGIWIAGPFGKDRQIGWITDISTGATVQATFRRRQGEPGDHIAELSREAAQALGLRPDQVANLALYLPR